MDPRQAIGRVSDELREWLEALRVALAAESACLWSRVASRLELELCATEEDAEERAVALELKGHALGWVVSEGVSLRAARDDVFHDAHEGWIVAAPVTDRDGDRFGCVTVEFEGPPPSSSVRVLEHASAVAGRFVSDARAAMGAVEDVAKYEALYGAVSDLDRELELEGLARGVCQRARDVCGAQGALVAAWDPQTQRATIVSVDGSTDPDLAGSVIEGDVSFLGLALCNATALPRDDLNDQDEFPLYSPGSPTNAGSAIIVPMLVDSVPVGAIAVEFDEPRQFSGGDARRVHTLARFVAVSFRNALEFGQVRDESLTDPLTGLSNRRGTERALASTAAVAERSGSPFAVAILDIDHFKAFNDRYGHDAGDLVLQRVAAVIRDSLRPGDTAGRWGGEEFLIVLPSTGLGDAIQVAERIRRNVEGSPVSWAGKQLAVTVSGGVSTFPEVTPRPDRAVPTADAALYEAKRTGRNAIVTASSSG